MNMDRAPADSAVFGYAGGGDAGRGRVEHRSLRQMRSLNLSETVYLERIGTHGEGS